MSTTPDSRFNDFVILQAQSAGLFLGQVPNPVTGKKELNLQAAESVLSSLEMLENKTKGNLSENETKLLKTALDNLKRLYDEVTNQ